MDIEAIVKKHARLADGMRYWDAELLLRAALTEMAAGYEQRLNKIQSNDLMAECMEQTRSDLIAAGVIDKTCAPMFLTDAVISRVRNLEQKDYTGGDAELLRERIRQLEAERYGMALVPRKLLGKFPELNTNNYDHDDVDELNSWGIELLLASVPRRCHLCNYQHGHQIGCENNPVDIALRAAKAGDK